LPRRKARFDAAVHGADPQPADTLQLGAACLPEHRLAYRVLHAHAVHIVAVAVQHSVDAAGMFDHIRIGVRPRFFAVAQMRQQYDILRAFTAGPVHRLLYCVVQLRAFASPHKAVDVIALAVLEMVGRRAGEAVGRGDADERDLYAAGLPDGIGREHQIALSVEAAADIGKPGRIGQGEEALHAIVEFMVAGNGGIIAQAVHHVDDRLYLGQKRLASIFD